MPCEAHPPVDPSTSRMVSRFGIRPGRLTRAPTFHAGLDFRPQPARGSAVYAVAAGTVERLGRDEDRSGGMRGYGNAVVLRHAMSWRGHAPLWTLYAHLDDTAVTEGQRVAAGDLLGHTGNTTNGKFPGMGPHLHFELRRQGSGGSLPFPGPYRAYNLDPEPWLSSLGISFGHHGEISWSCPRAPLPPLAAWLRNPWRSLTVDIGRTLPRAGAS